MSAVDEIITGIQSSPKIDAGTREVLVQFLQAGAPILNTLEASALQELMQWIAGGSQQTPPPAVDAMTPNQVIGLLSVTQQEMTPLLEKRSAEVAAGRAAVGNLGNVALSLLARLIVAAL